MNKISLTVTLESTKELPLELHLNTTLGELLSDERTKELGMELKGMIDCFFGSTQKEEDDAKDQGISENMGDVIAMSMPIRNLISFGICTKEELLKKL